MNLPNKLTLFRVLLIPLFLLVLVLPLDWGSVLWAGTFIPMSRIVGAIIFIVACLSDFLDGYISRKYNEVSNFGKFVDPLADKMMVMTALVILVGSGSIPDWVVVLILFREFAVTGLRLVLQSNSSSVLAAGIWGKVKTVTQMLAIIILLLNNAFFNNINLPLGSILLYIALFFTLSSGLEYYLKNWNKLKSFFNH